MGDGTIDVIYCHEHTNNESVTEPSFMLILYDLMLSSVLELNTLLCFEIRFGSNTSNPTPRIKLLVLSFNDSGKFKLGDRAIIINRGADVTL